jgi:hypothetical protein
MLLIGGSSHVVIPNTARNLLSTPISTIAMKFPCYTDRAIGRGFLATLRFARNDGLCKG